MKRYVVESRTRNQVGGWGDWSTYGMGSNEPRTRAECERGCEELPTLGADWSAAEYRVTEVQS